MTLAQDPEERFDLYTRAGEPLGRSKARRDVHRDGDWHKSLHLWVWGLIEREPHVVLQRRSLAKDTSPGLLDAAVTGHARAGETLRETLREAEEEIGLTVGLADVVHLGTRRRSVAIGDLRDNEIQDVFARRDPVELGDLTPNLAEVTELVWVPLAGGLRAVLPQMVAAPDGYYERALAILREVIDGRTPERWEIG